MHREKINLDRNGRKEARGHITGPLYIALIFFLVAGRLDLYRGWIWAILNSVYYLGGMLVILKVNPGLFNARGSWIRKKGVKTWDKILLFVFAGIGLYGHTILIALDVGRFGWTSLSPWFLIPGIILFTGSFNLVYWSMAVNNHFETAVRIQEERDHKPVTRGPYQLVRHPGYLGLILAPFGSAMIVGSFLGLLTATANMGVLVLRTWLEDRTLLTELEGYTAYARETPRRLIPFVW